MPLPLSESEWRTRSPQSPESESTPAQNAPESAWISRQVEAMARDVAQKGAKGQTNGRKANERAEKNANLLALEKRISDALGLAVSIDDRGRGGVLSIRYRNLDQLDEVLRRLEKNHS